MFFGVFILCLCIYCIYFMQTMQQKLEELKKSIEDHSKKQKLSLKKVINEVWSALFNSFKNDLKGEMK